MKNGSRQRGERAARIRAYIPWHVEPDRLQWVDDTTGLHCAIYRHSSGKHLCGYVGIVDTSHPLHGADEGEIYAAGLYAHGGITHTRGGNLSGRVKTTAWWIGFDCAHLGDMSPGWRLDAPHARGETYRTIEYVKSEVEYLAKQIAEKAIDPEAIERRATRDREALVEQIVNGT